MTVPPERTETLPRSLRQMRTLLSPYGLVSRTHRLAPAHGEPPFEIYSSYLGNPGAVLAAQSAWDHDLSQGNFDGAGGALDPEVAAHLSIAESLERYSSCAWDSRDMFWATAEELGDDAIAPAAFPNCSERELADPSCGLVPSDPRIPLRWVQGWSFTRDRPVYVPALTVWMRFPPESAAERFMHPISTGCAAHSDPVAAVVNGLLEVVERDAIALTWLQRMRLPRLHVDEGAFDDLSRRYAAKAESQHLRTELFDATTDLGIPVIYGVQLADHDPEVAQMVAATCDPDPARAVAKMYREMASLRIALRHIAKSSRDIPLNEDNTSVFGGALMSGTVDQRHRFDFLLEGERETRDIRDVPSIVSDSPTDKLDWLMRRMDAAGCEVVAVDITTDEARQVGATVTRILVPQLMPLSFVHKARYLAHARLYEAPRAMGHHVHAESEINPHLQPFA
ncbi:YcaO-like family protein [Spiractinospora alimapuensis]|uniref:YcaO-like family protein n=1 Tax=Spiractinospora alimapuensis TaxID=2820884 RepID=UPI001F307617|nr:YcaO-like family protein [Spiractinospora alimapuensis]QVQ50236.1 YcaO-like family protein [Spiractinospora alimapuensis]